MSKKNCAACGHPKIAHIYEEGACRPGFACSCQKFQEAALRRPTKTQLEFALKAEKQRRAGLEEDVKIANKAWATNRKVLEQVERKNAELEKELSLLKRLFAITLGARLNGLVEFTDKFLECFSHPSSTVTVEHDATHRITRVQATLIPAAPEGRG